MANFVKRAWKSAVEAVWPTRCVVCGLADSSSRQLCPSCQDDFPVAAGRCAQCALPLARDVHRCGRCISREPFFDAAAAVWLYQSPVSALVQRFKFNGGLAEGHVLARFMAESLANQRVARPQLMIPVPLHWRRRWRRGFNQAELLCRDLSPRLDSLPWANILHRQRPTPAQSDLPASRRRGNVRGAFTLKLLTQGLTHAALVDDVMTTGATVNECARVLKQSGVQRVDVWIIARA